MHSLITLPEELLVMLPNYMHNIEDYTNTSSCCRKLRAVFTDTSPSTILRLAAASSRIFFRPDPYFLVMATAKEIGRWGLKSPENTELLRAAMRRGIDGLHELCLAKCGLTMDRIRHLHLARFDLINPASDMIDKMAGKQWYQTPNFWNGGVSEPNTVQCDPERSLFQFVIYGELFGSTMDAHLQPELSLPRYDLDTRLDYIRYCIPDQVCYHGTPGLPWPQRDGPYATQEFHGDGMALWHITRCGRWERAWEAVRKASVPELEPFAQPWRQDLWNNAIQYQGLEGLKMLRPDGPEQWKARIVEIYHQIERLKDSAYLHPRRFGDRGNVAFECPDLCKEMYLCIAYYWQSRSIGVDPWITQQRQLAQSSNTLSPDDSIEDS
jgi:hypothetical protein